MHVYKMVHATGEFHPIPVLRSFLCGSAGSGKSTTIKTIVQHVRLLFQQEQVDAQIELTAYTGVAAFNIGFGAGDGFICDINIRLSGCMLVWISASW